MNYLENLSIRTILITAVAAFIAMLVIVGATGISGGRNEHAADLNAVADRTREAEVARMIGLMEINRAQVMLAMQHNPSYEFAAQHNHAVSKHVDEIGRA